MHEGEKEYYRPCWNCDQGVSLSFLGQTCPFCGASLTSADYDLSAQDLLRDLQRFQNERAIYKAKLADIKKRQKALRQRHRILGWLYDRCSSRHHRDLEQTHKRIARRCSTIKRRLGKYAEARYYATQWFREKRIMLAITVKSSSPFRDARYDGQGKHFLRIGQTSDARGLLGEYMVFDILSSAIEAGEIEAAELVLGLYIPIQCKPRSCFLDRAYTEIDCVLVTRKAVYVIEVKNLYGRISCAYKRKQHEYRVYLECAGGGKNRIESTHREDRGPVQNDEHRSALIHAVECPAESTFNIVSYVDNLGFKAPSRQGVNNTYITTDNEMERANILKMIRHIEDSLPPIRSYEEMKALSRELSYRFKDADGSKKKSHQERLQRERSIREVCFS